MRLLRSDATRILRSIFMQNCLIENCPIFIANYFLSHKNIVFLKPMRIFRSIFRILESNILSHFHFELFCPRLNFFIFWGNRASEWKVDRNLIFRILFSSNRIIALYCLKLCTNFATHFNNTERNSIQRRKNNERT